MNHEDEFSNTNRWKQRANWVLIGFFLIGGYFLITEHRAHLAGLLYYLPFLLLLACPLMHVFMHGGHGGHGRQGDERAPDPSDGQDERSGRKEVAASRPHQHLH